VRRYKFLILLTFLLVSCGSSSDCFREEVFCAGLVTDTLGIDDHGPNQEAWLGLEQSQTDKVTDHVAYIETVDTRDYGKNIDYFIEQGYDVIITSGIGLDDETLQAATLSPDTVFIGINQPQTEAPKNLIPLTFAEDQMGFLAGALAAQLTETNIVGAVCETAGIDSMWRYCEGFRAGAEYIDDSIRAVILYREGEESERLFIDEAWGMEQGHYLINRGVDVIFAAGGATGQAALRVANEEGIYAIGTERDQAALLAGSGKGVVTSIYGQTSFEVQRMMRLIKEGIMPLPELGQFGYVPLSQKLPESLSVDLDRLRDDLINGEVQTSVLLQKP
jgi:basic membrane protein A and related proteins